MYRTLCSSAKTNYDPLHICGMPGTENGLSRLCDNDTYKSGHSEMLLKRYQYPVDEFQTCGKNNTAFVNISEHHVVSEVDLPMDEEYHIAIDAATIVGFNDSLQLQRITIPSKDKGN